MKLENQINRVSTNLNSKVSTFGTNIEDSCHIEHIVRNQLYEDKELAPIREYSINAIDANIEVNSTRPIEIHLPTQEEPYFGVRDFGTGLTPDDIVNLYTRYGKSTKRDSNNVTGCLGIGCKSAFAYTDSFSIFSTVNHKLYQYVAYLEDNTAKIRQVIEPSPTLLPNGVEIRFTINSEDTTSIGQKFFAMSRYWPTDIYKIVHPMIKNGNCSWNDENTDEPKPETDMESLNKITLEGPSFKIYADSDQHYVYVDDWAWNSKVSAGGYGRASVLMGHIAYEINTNIISNDLTTEQKFLLESPKLILKAPLGLLSIAASREGLEYTNQTKAALISLTQSALDEVKAGIERKLMKHSNLQTAYDDFTVIMQGINSSLLSLLKPEWKGHKLAFQYTWDYLNDNGDKSGYNCNLRHTYLKSGRYDGMRMFSEDKQSYRPQPCTRLCYYDINTFSKGQAGRKLKYLLDANPDFHYYTLILNYDCHWKSDLKMTKLPGNFKDFDPINLEELEIPKTYKAKAASTACKARKIKFLELDMKAERWDTRAFEAADKEYDVDDETLLAFPVSNYKPKNVVLKPAIKGTETILYKNKIKFIRFVDPPAPSSILTALKLINQINDTKIEYKIAPLRPSQLKKVNIPRFSDLLITTIMDFIMSDPVKFYQSNMPVSSYGYYSLMNMMTDNMPVEKLSELKCKRLRDMAIMARQCQTGINYMDECDDEDPGGETQRQLVNKVHQLTQCFDIEWFRPYKDGHTLVSIRHNIESLIKTMDKRLKLPTKADLPAPKLEAYIQKYYPSTKHWEFQYNTRDKKETQNFLIDFLNKKIR